MPECRPLLPANRTPAYPPLHLRSADQPGDGPMGVSPQEQLQAVQQAVIQAQATARATQPVAPGAGPVAAQQEDFASTQQVRPPARYTSECRAWQSTCIPPGPQPLP